MKFIKEHIMFILPMMAILLGIQFFLVFDRMTHSYEERLKEGYAMLVVANEPMELEEFQALNKEVASASKIERNEILKQVSAGQTPKDTQEILDALPHFYSVKLANYLDTSALEKVEQTLKSSDKIKRVETFGSSYGSNYRLFSFIKFTLKVFIFFMVIVSLFLVIKQMEVWGYKHKERMQVMEIFGAPLMLRSGVLFKIALLDALIAAVLIVLLFVYLRFGWAQSSGVDVMIQNKMFLFQSNDLLILVGSALFIVIVSVFAVVFSAKETEE
ncbi:MAG TPA: cell division protein FtsX [Epsilonproteobacteria bacterium]|nr:cell division protein FtsX [Campylobacterota bacterium]